jgi:hypothetical protein
MTRVVRVNKPRSSDPSLPVKKPVASKSSGDPWNPPEIKGKSIGEIHDYFEHLGCRAAREGKKALKDAHDAWLHGWLMEMEDQGKLEHLKVEDIDTEPFLYRKRTKQEMTDYDQGFKAGTEGKGSHEGKSFAWYRGWAEAQE